jgi:hypothetical protein
MEESVARLALLPVVASRATGFGREAHSQRTDIPQYEANTRRT